MYSPSVLTIVILLLALNRPATLAQHKKELSVYSGTVLSLKDLRSRPYNGDNLFSPKDLAIAAQFSYQVYGNFYLSFAANATFLHTRKDMIEKEYDFSLPDNWKGGEYKISSYLLGPKYNLPLSTKMSLGSAVRFGVSKMKVSDIRFIKIYNLNSSYQYIEVYTFDKAFCLDVEFELNYNLSHSFGVHLDINYYSQKFNETMFLVSGPIDDNSGFALASLYRDKMKANMIVPSLGIKYIF